MKSTEKIFLHRASSTKEEKLLWQWRNDPLTRALSRSDRSISWQEHRLWFEQKAPSGSLLIATSPPLKEPWGLFRFDSITCYSAHNESNSGVNSGKKRPILAIELSILIAPSKRAQGLGRKLLRAGIEYLEALYHAYSSPIILWAQIDQDNPASKKVFFRIAQSSIQEKEALEQKEGRASLSLAQEALLDAAKRKCPLEQKKRAGWLLWWKAL